MEELAKMSRFILHNLNYFITAQSLVLILLVISTIQEKQHYLEEILEDLEEALEPLVTQVEQVLIWETTP